MRNAKSATYARRRVGDVHLDRRKLHPADRGDESRVAAGESVGIDDGGIDAPVVRRVEAIDHLALDVRVKDLDLYPERARVLADLDVVFREGQGPEHLRLHLAAHVHAGAVNDQDLHVRTSFRARIATTRRRLSTAPLLTPARPRVSPRGPDTR